MFQPHLLIILPDSIVHSMLSDLLLPISTARDGKRRVLTLPRKDSILPCCSQGRALNIFTRSMRLHKMEVSSSHHNSELVRCVLYFPDSALSVLRDWESR